MERQGDRWVNRLLASSGFNISTFGADEAGEIFVANAANGTLHRLEGSLAPRLSAAGVVNAASFAQGLTPGSLATAFAAGVLDEPGILGAPGIPLGTSLGGVSITVNGIAAPIHLVANRNGQEQVNFQVPFEIRGRTSASVVVTRDGQSSAAVDVPVFDVQPAVYTSGGDTAVVVRAADYLLATADRPLARGEYAFVYATGLGRATNEPATGAGAPLLPLAAVAADVRVSLGGLECEVQFAGFAPSLVGVYQVNFRAAASAPGGLQDLVISAGGSTSPAVKVAVR